MKEPREKKKEKNNRQQHATALCNSTNNNKDKRLADIAQLCEFFHKVIIPTVNKNAQKGYSTQAQGACGRRHAQRDNACM